MSATSQANGPGNEPAELAHVAAVAMRGGSTGVSFAIVHLPDKPWVLSDTLRFLTEVRPLGDGLEPRILASEWAETLSAAAYGSGVLVFAGRSGVPDSRLSHDPVVVSELSVAELHGCYGTGLPNPSFLYDSARYAEALLTLDARDRALDFADALLLASVLKGIAGLAADEQYRAPILFLQAPASPAFDLSSNTRGDGTNERWRPASGFVVRFSVGLSQLSPSHRMLFTRELTAYAEERGFGFQIGDRRIGRRSGEWFRILQPDPESFDHFKVHHFRDAVGVLPRRAIPITLVGPARVGSTLACAALIEGSRMGCLGAAITSLEDLAFIHVLLPVALAKSEADVPVRVGDAREGLMGMRRYCSLTTQRRLARSADYGDFLRASDYKAVIGPSVSVDTTSDTERMALWAGWEVPYSEDALCKVVEALRSALAHHVGRSNEAMASIEYMVCRRVDEDLLRGRCKLSVDATMPGAFGADPDRLTQTCRLVEGRWRDALSGLGYGDGVSVEVELAWRERWLGRWATIRGRSRRS